MEKKEVILLGLEVEGRRDTSRFSESAGGVDGVAGAGAAKGLKEGLRDRVERDPSVLIGVVRSSNFAPGVEDCCRLQDSTLRCAGCSSELGGKRRC